MTVTNKDLKQFEEQRFQIRAALDDIRYGSSPETAIKIMEQELAELHNQNIHPKRKASEDFLNAVRHSGSIVIDCELCGRTHFASAAENFYDDEQELIDLRAKAKTEPDKYLEDETVDYISWGTVDGKQVVLDCPCNGARRYEDWIWRHRWVIADYLEARAKELTRKAESVTQMAKTAHESVEASLRRD